jgi:MFS family permease
LSPLAADTMGLMDASRFQRVLAAESVSNFGSMLSRLAIPWLAALQLQATPGQMAGLLVADVLAGGLGALLLGGVVDRSAKRRVMLLADAGRVLVMALLAVGAWQGGLNMPLLWLAAAASGLLTVAFEMARSAWTALCVPVEELPRRNAQLSVAGSVSEALAFAAGGWLFQALGAALALLIDAFSYALSALCLRGVPAAAPVVQVARETGRWRSAWDDARAGLHTVWHTPTLRALCIVRMLLDVCFACFGAAFMIYVTRDLGLATGPLGTIFALGAVASIVGAALATRLGRAWGPGRTISVGLLLLTIGLACVPLASGAGWLAIAALVAQQLVGDAGHTMHDVHDRTLRQSAVVPELLARADAGIRSAGHAATLFGAVLAGWLGDAFGARTVLWLAVAVSLLAAVWALLRLAERPYFSSPST